VSERRRFNQSERDYLWELWGGRCAECDCRLEVGWHSDHDIPHAAGGPTALGNGRPLCPDCNQKKGARMDLRRAQQQLQDRVLDNIARKVPLTVAVLAPGAGKTLGGHAVGNALYQAGRIDTAVWFTPRLNLCQQIELEWQQRGAGFPAPRMGSIVRAPNRRPLLKPDDWGYTTTYASLVARQGMHLDFAQEHLDRFLLVCDEAQILGISDIGGGTQAAALIQQIQPLASHTILLTGTQYRADNRPLLLARYGEPDAHGDRKLLADIESGYREGIDEGYLRPYQADISDAEMDWRWADGGKEHWRLSEQPDELYKFVTQPQVWRPLVDQTVDRVRRVQKLDQRYCGLVAAAGQQEVTDICGYLTHYHPNVKVLAARSDDGPAALNNLKAFRQGGHDLLVTVRMAYIGYDCPQITAVCVLTNFRDKGHLFQLIGRGIRVWRERPVREQHVYVIAPKDDRMRQFLEELRAESDAGLKGRQQREREQDATRALRLGYAEGAKLTDTAIIGLDPEGDLTAEQRVSLRELQERHGLVMAPESGLASLLRATGATLPGAVASQAAPTPTAVIAAPPAKTREELRKEWGARCNKAVALYLRRREGLDSRDATFQPRIMALNHWLNNYQGVPNVEHLTITQWQQRYETIQSWFERGAP
jgi:superfamily II DNA or RNA helicase